MENKDIISIIAIVVTPFITWYITIKYQERKEKRKAKLDLFLTLMANRKKYPPIPEWPDALNKIDVVFQDSKRVRASWKAYFDSLHPKSQHADNANSFLLDLLSDMAHELGYKHLRQTEIDNFYYPSYYGNQHENQNLILGEYLRVLSHSKNFGQPLSDEERKELEKKKSNH